MQKSIEQGRQIASLVSDLVRRWDHFGAQGMLMLKLYIFKDTHLARRKQSVC